MGVLSFLKSTILSKVVMALTGLILVLFIVGHTIGNLQIFLGAEVFNTYAAFLQGLGELLWAIRGGLLIALALHIFTSIRLKMLNNGAKPQAYKVKKYVKSTLGGRTMIWTGLMIFAFLVYHILHFTSGVVQPEYFHFVENYGPNGMFERHDVFAMVIKGFQEPLVSGFYILGVILLGFHLSHAVQSMFQTLGLNNPKYFGTIEKASVAFGAIIALALISIPVSILLGFGGNL